MTNELKLKIGFALTTLLRKLQGFSVAQIPTLAGSFEIEQSNVKLLEIEKARDEILRDKLGKVLGELSAIQHVIRLHPTLMCNTLKTIIEPLELKLFSNNYKFQDDHLSTPKKKLIYVRIPDTKRVYVVDYATPEQRHVYTLTRVGDEPIVRPKTGLYID